jgi:hypothetical protein
MGEVLISQQRPAVRASATAVGGAAGQSLVSVVVKTIDGTSPVFNCQLYLSDAATGAGLTAVTASGAVAAGASGTVIGADVVAKKAFNIQTTATGLFILAITDTLKTPFVVCVVIEGRTYPLITLATGNYT